MSRIAFWIDTSLLPEATHEMRHSDAFEFEIIDILVGKIKSMLICEMKGSYPYVTEQWKAKFRLEPE